VARSSVPTPRSRLWSRLAGSSAITIESGGHGVVGNETYEVSDVSPPMRSLEDFANASREVSCDRRSGCYGLGHRSLV